MKFVQGLWHLKLSVASLASVGHQIVGLDFCNDVVKELTAGTAPVFEPGLMRS